MDDGARAGRTFLPLKAEGGGDDTGRGLVNIHAGIDDDGVLAAHLGHDALDPALTSLMPGGALVDAQADLLRTGKGDVAGERMVYNHVADLTARADHKVDDARRHPGLFQQLEELV